MRISPFVRGLLIIAAVSALIMVLDAETSLVTAALLVRVAFFLSVAFVAYMLWRDFGRREISMWSGRLQWIFYLAILLFVIDLGWFFWTGPRGLDALAFILVGAITIFVDVRIWLAQRNYGGGY